jgi:hypothetical protein
MNGHALNVSCHQAERQPEAEAWLRRVLVRFDFRPAHGRRHRNGIAVIGSFRTTGADIRARVNAATNLTEGLSTMGPPAAPRLR